MKTRKKFLGSLTIAVIASVIATVSYVEAAYLRDVPQALIQPDGTVIHCFASGDEYYNWLHDEDGFTIIEDQRSGYYVYAIKGADGKLEPSLYTVGQVNPNLVGLERNVRISPEIIKARMSKRDSYDTDINYAPQTGVINNIVIFIRFSDEAEFIAPKSFYTNMLNTTTSGVNSVYNYFKEVSYNKLSINSNLYPESSGTTVVSYRDSHPRAYYKPYSYSNTQGYNTGDELSDREHTLLANAIDAIKTQVPSTLIIDADNDGNVDCVTFIVSGSPYGWNDLLWPHQWGFGYSSSPTINGKKVSSYNFQLNGSLGVGVLCHEILHVVGFPDLYHYYYKDVSTVGSWDVMESNSDPPEHTGAYMKWKYGKWISSIPTITASGTYTLNPLTSSTNNCYKIASPNSTTEYYIVEYRKKSGTFENSLPGEGLLVYRINSGISGNSLGPPDEVYIYRPGGTSNTTPGNIDSANFSSNVGRTAINNTTSPSGFLSNGTPGGLNISNIGMVGSTISFYVSFGNTVKTLVSGYIRDSSDNPGIGVTLTFSNGEGTTITDSSGFYTKTVNSGWSGTVTPSKGSYRFTPPNQSYTSLTSDMPDQNYKFVASNKAIIVAGGGNYASNILWNATKKNADIAYQALEFQGYNPENIYYLSADKNFTSPADGFASNANLRNAIGTWAQDAASLVIYMVDHGGNGTFKMNEGEGLRASELDGWLDSLQQTIPGNVILIYDACESGSFVSYLIPPTGKNRIIATSSSADEPAVFASDGALSFSWIFWTHILSGFPFYDSFVTAQNSMELFRNQHSQIEADGNGSADEKADTVLAASVRFGEGIASGADFPVIGSVSPPQTLTDKTSALIYADAVIDMNGIKKVWIAITPPKNVSCSSADIPITSLPTTELMPVGNNRYQATYDGFTTQGTYKIAVFATDTKDFTSVPETKHITYVTQTQDFSPPVKKGDISGDNQVNLADVISGLQVLSGLNPAQIRCDYSTSGADVNGDGRVGLQEVIYILQAVAGLR